MTHSGRQLTCLIPRWQKACTRQVSYILSFLALSSRYFSLLIGVGRRKARGGEMNPIAAVTAVTLIMLQPEPLQVSALATWQLTAKPGPEPPPPPPPPPPGSGDPIPSRSGATHATDDTGEPGSRTRDYLCALAGKCDDSDVDDVPSPGTKGFDLTRPSARAASSVRLRGRHPACSAQLQDRCLQKQEKAPPRRARSARPS